LGPKARRPADAGGAIDPTEFVPHLPGIMLVDVVADERRYVYRLVGTREVERAVGTRRAGRSARVSTAARARTCWNYDWVCRERRVVRRLPFHLAWRPASRAGHILPLSADGESVNQIMVYTHHRRLP
jgi:hypothetical protein